MGDDAKYIMILSEDLETPIIFPPWLKHSDVAEALGYFVLSAGFVSISKEGKALAYGESTSLKLKSGPDDSRYIQRMLVSE